MLCMHRKIFYALEAVLYIAYNSKARPISSRDIAKRQGLPPRYLEQIMQRLVKCGILRGVRGPHGGYLLARERRRISVGEIYEIIADEEEEVKYTPTPLGKGLIMPLCEEVKANTLALLKDKNLADMCNRAAKLGIKHEEEETETYSI